MCVLQEKLAYSIHLQNQDWFTYYKQNFWEVSKKNEVLERIGMIEKLFF
jgi:hypothetical protein